MSEPVADTSSQVGEFSFQGEPYCDVFGSEDKTTIVDSEYSFQGQSYIAPTSPGQAPRVIITSSAG
jgi:hypothetical protein